MNEFNSIKQYFTRRTHHTDMSVGDDAALIAVSAGMQLAVSTDMLVAGTHFFADAAPHDIGWKALAVNVSDMAAMGANPKWATLAIALPQILPSPSQGEGQDGGRSFTPTLVSTPTPALPLKEGGGINEAWIAEFSRGFFACADAFNIDLIGGDTTRGPLNISVTIMGEVPTGEALRRDGAKIDDDIWVSGQLGSAALGLAHLQGKTHVPEAILPACLNTLHTPTPRAALGLALRSIATSCIDVSDGLLADLGHLLKASHCGATLDLEKIPCIEYFKNDLDNAEIQQMLLAGGDDYELCFTAPKSKCEEINLLSKQLNLAITCIASTRTDIGLQVYYKNNQITLLKQGFDHFG